MGKRWRHKDQVILGRNQVLAVIVLTLAVFVFSAYALADVFKIPALHPAFAPLLIFLPLYRMLYLGFDAIRWVLSGLFALFGLLSLLGAFFLYSASVEEHVFITLIIGGAVFMVSCLILVFSETIRGFMVLQQELRRRN